MKLLDILQGKWLGHPLHPAIVHVPVGLWPMATLIDLVIFFGAGGDTLARLSFYAVVVGLAAALLAVPTGLADWAPIKKEKPAWKLGLYHLVLNLAAAACWVINAVLRYQAFGQPEVMTGPILATSVAGTLLVLIGGYLGSRLVFAYGVSVARQSKKKWRAIAVAGGAKLPEEK
jgi:uncharacterized membrane protein